MKILPLFGLLTASILAQDVPTYMLGTTHIAASNPAASALTTTSWVGFGFYNNTADRVVKVRAYLGGTASGMSEGQVTMGIHNAGADGKPSTAIVTSSLTEPSVISGTAGTPVDWVFSQDIATGYYWLVAKNTAGGTVSLRSGLGASMPFLMVGSTVGSSWAVAAWNGSIWTVGSGSPYVLITFSSGRQIGVPVTTFAGDPTNSSYATREPANSLAPQTVTLKVSAVCMNLTRAGTATVPLQLWVGHSASESSGVINKTYAAGGLWTGVGMDTTPRPYCDYFNTPVTIPAGSVVWVGMSGGDTSLLRYMPGVVTLDSSVASKFKPLGATFRYCTSSCTDASNFTTVNSSQYIPFILQLAPGNEISAPAAKGGAYTFIQ